MGGAWVALRLSREAMLGGILVQGGEGVAGCARTEGAWGGECDRAKGDAAGLCSDKHFGVRVDGRLYSFVLRYVEDTAVLNYRVVVGGQAAPVMLSGLTVNESRLAADAAMLAGQRAFVHRSVHAAGIRLQLRGIWCCDSLQWFCLSVRNQSALPCSPFVLRFYLQDRARVRRRAVQELELSPGICRSGCCGGRCGGAVPGRVHPLHRFSGQRADHRARGAGWTKNCGYTSMRVW